MENEYDRAADKCLKDAELIQKRVEQYLEKRKQVKDEKLRALYDRNIRILSSMYHDCIDQADTLRRRAIHIRKQAEDRNDMNDEIIPAATGSF